MSNLSKEVLIVIWVVILSISLAIGLNWLAIVGSDWLWAWFGGVEK